MGKLLAGTQRSLAAGATLCCTSNTGLAGWWGVKRLE